MDSGPGPVHDLDPDSRWTQDTGPADRVVSINHQLVVTTWHIIQRNRVRVGVAIAFRLSSRPRLCMSQRKCEGEINEIGNENAVGMTRKLQLGEQRASSEASVPLGTGRASTA